MEDNLAISGFVQTEHGTTSSAFATPRLTDQPKCFAFADMEIDAVYRFDGTRNTPKQA